MARRRSTEAHLTVPTFKGVNLTDPEHVIDDKEFASVQNLIINDAGDLIRRKPLRVFHNPEDAPRGFVGMLGIFYNRILFTSGDNVYLSPVDTDLSDTYVAISGVGEDAASAVLYNKNIYIWSNSSSPSLTALTVSDWQADSPTIGGATITGTPPDNIVKSIIFKDRMFAMKDPGDQSSRITYSAVNDPGNWTGGGFFDVSPGDGDYVSDICPFGERLFIFKRNSTYTLTIAGDPSGWVLKQFDKSVGAIHPFNTLEYRGLLYCLSTRGLYRSDGVVFDYVGYPVQDRWIDTTNPIPAGSSYGYDTFICMVDDYIFVCSGIQDVGYWFYNPVQNAWTEMTFSSSDQIVAPNGLRLGIQGYLKNGTRVTVFGTFRLNLANLVWFGLTDPQNLGNTAWSDYCVFQSSPGSRIIEPVLTSFKTKEWDMGSFVNVKRHKVSAIEMVVPEQGQVIDAEFHTTYKYDRAGTTPTHEFRVDSDHRGNMAHRVPGVGYARRLQLQFSSDTPVDYSITGYDLTFFTKDEAPNPS